MDAKVTVQLSVLSVYHNNHNNNNKSPPWPSG